MLAMLSSHALLLGTHTPSHEASMRPFDSATYFSHRDVICICEKMLTTFAFSTPFIVVWIVIEFCCVSIVYKIDHQWLRNILSCSAPPTTPHPKLRCSLLIPGPTFATGILYVYAKTCLPRSHSCLYWVLLLCRLYTKLIINDCANSCIFLIKK